MKPTLLVLVAEPEIFKPESVVVPKPVEETERNESLVEPAALVEDATLKSVGLVNPYAWNRERLASGVVVPIPSVPAKYAFPVVVAPPEIVRPPICVPSPMVVDAKERRPPVNVAKLVNVLKSEVRSVEDAELPPDVRHVPLIA